MFSYLPICFISLQLSNDPFFDPQYQSQSQGAITFKIIPSTKEETASKEGKVSLQNTVCSGELNVIFFN